MSEFQKQVRFSDQARRSSHIEETLRLTNLPAPEGNEKYSGEEMKKKKKKKKSHLQVLKAEKKKLAKELKGTKKHILQDKKKKESEDYTPYENRQRLARTTSDLQSKIQQIESKISTKKKVRKEKVNKSVNTKVKKKYIRADKQHKRLIKMTGRLERIKLDEENLRAEIAREPFRPERVEAPSRMSSAQSACSTSTSTSESQLPIIESGKWRRLSRNETLGSQLDTKIEGNVMRPQTASPIPSQPEVLLQRRRLSLHDKTIKADKLANNYELTRELRNTIHQHMISRAYSFSYLNIIPPYKRRKPKPQKSRQFFNRKVYEDKIAVVDYSRKYGEGKIPVVKV